MGMSLCAAPHTRHGQLLPHTGSSTRPGCARGTATQAHTVTARQRQRLMARQAQRRRARPPTRVSSEPPSPSEAMGSGSCACQLSRARCQLSRQQRPVAVSCASRAQSAAPPTRSRPAAPGSSCSTRRAPVLFVGPTGGGARRGRLSGGRLGSGRGGWLGGSCSPRVVLQCATSACA